MGAVNPDTGEWDRDLCSCGSGKQRWPEYDARGIFLAYVCEGCVKEKLSGYRQDVLDNPNYEADEDIEPDGEIW